MPSELILLLLSHFSSAYCTITTECSRYVTCYTYGSLGKMFTTQSYTLPNRKMFISSRSLLVGRSDRWLTEPALVRLGGTEVGAKAPTNEVAVVRRAYHSHFMSPMAA